MLAKWRTERTCYATCWMLSHDRGWRTTRNSTNSRAAMPKNDSHPNSPNGDPTWVLRGTASSSFWQLHTTLITLSQKGAFRETEEL